MGITDLIESFLIGSLRDADDGVLVVQRSDLAQRFHCVPSQINYVVATRFSPERGYVVESRRGTNGFIRITQVKVDRRTLIMHVINSLENGIDFRSAQAVLENLQHSGTISELACKTLTAAVNDKSLASVPRELRDSVRADILKNTLILQL